MTLQLNVPLFVKGMKRPVVWKGKSYTFQQEFPWVELDVPLEVVENLYAIGLIYHDERLIKQNNLGDKLDDCTLAQLETFVNLMNAHIKSVATTTKQASESRIKKSKNEKKQRAFIRTWLNRNEALTDKYNEILDTILK